MNKKITGFLTVFSAITLIFSFAVFASADYDETKAQGPGPSVSNQEIDQHNNSEQNQGVGSMNQEKNQEGFMCANQCGDGVCAEVVCQAEGCPCAENKNNCPQDCGESDSGNANANTNTGANVNANANAKANGQINAQEHKNIVSNFEQSLLNFVGSIQHFSSNLGQEVELIAQEQNASEETTIQAMEQVQTRNKVQTFLFGSDYENLGVLRSEIVQTRNRIQQLTMLMENTTGLDDASIEAVGEQMQILEQEQENLENFVAEQENSFSLFGWLVKLFNKQ